ncbi:MAG: 4Fe-4S binding protein [Candidatus Binatia bacterium]
MIGQTMRIDQDLCIDCGMCRETCPFGAVVSAFTLKHHYEILPDRCRWCGGPGKAPCAVFCPVENAIAPAMCDGPDAYVGAH